MPSRRLARVDIRQMNFRERNCDARQGIVDSKLVWVYAPADEGRVGRALKRDRVDDSPSPLN